MLTFAFWIQIRCLRLVLGSKIDAHVRVLGSKHAGVLDSIDAHARAFVSKSVLMFEIRVPLFCSGFAIDARLGFVEVGLEVLTKIGSASMTSGQI